MPPCFGVGWQGNERADPQIPPSAHSAVLRVPQDNFPLKPVNEDN